MNCSSINGIGFQGNMFTKFFGNKAKRIASEAAEIQTKKINSFKKELADCFYYKRQLPEDHPMKAAMDKYMPEFGKDQRGFLNKLNNGEIIL